MNNTDEKENNLAKQGMNQNQITKEHRPISNKDGTACQVAPELLIYLDFIFFKFLK